MEREICSSPHLAQSAGWTGQEKGRASKRGDRDEVQVSPREGKQGRGTLDTPANPSPFLLQPSVLESTFMYIVSVCVYRERYRFLIQNSFLSAHANMRFVFPNLSPCIGGLHTEVLNTAVGNEKGGYHFAASPVKVRVLPARPYISLPDC